jgi:molybdenum cofactor biosynthesis protein B
MGHIEHRHGAPRTADVAILTVSTTRALETDESGHWMARRAVQEGHRVVAHEVVTDQADAIRQSLSNILASASPQVVIVTGGTGITPADVTIEAVKPLFIKELTAFGILFTQLSFDEIQAAAMISRATAGVIGQTLVFCIPGSLNACKLACNKLILPEMGHLVRHAGGQ